MASENVGAVAVPPAPAAAAAAPPSAALFQKAHAKMLALGRIDEQLQALLAQRRKVQDELKGVQSMINDEFDRVMRDAQAGAAPAKAAAAARNGAPVGANRLAGAGV